MGQQPDPACHEPEWLAALSRPETYPHPVGTIERLETHISWVFLTGEWAYKLKKPVQFRFVDFSTLELRRAACFEELKLNRRTAPDLYESVLELTRTAQGPRWNGGGEVLEYAVRMRQFPQPNLLLAQLNAGRLTSGMMQALAIQLATFHEQAELAAADSGFGTPALVKGAVDECFQSIRSTTLTDSETADFHWLETWAEGEAGRLLPEFERRLRQGRVRDCHGDLHLGNLVLLDGVPRPFDCLEFNSRLRWVDVLSDLAFLVMDLNDHAAEPLAWEVLNGWLERTGDYEGLKVLRYYLVYRALVRAKVAALRLTQAGLSNTEELRVQQQREGYLSLARRFCESDRPALLMLHGLSGSGKSVAAARLAAALGGIRLRSDIERKRLAGIWPPEIERPETDENLYTSGWSSQTYQRLEELAAYALDSGHLTIVDAAFLRAGDRQRFVQLAEDRGIPAVMVGCTAPVELLRRRIAARQQRGADPSDATLAVLEWQMQTREPLTEDEQRLSLTWNTADAAELIAAVNQRIRRANR